MLQKKSTAKIVLNVSRTSPRVPVRCLDADVWRIGKRGIKAVQMPVRVTKVALQHLALMATRNTALRTQDGLVVTVKYPRVVRLLVAIPAVLCAVSR